MVYKPKMSREKFYKQAAWQLRLALLPKTCDISGEPIWFTYAYRGRLYIHSLLGESPTIEDRWLKPHEYIIARLKDMVSEPVK